jgi:hypothetical protein
MVDQGHCILYRVVGEIHEFDGDDNFTNMFDGAETRKSNYYASRNKCLSQLIASSTSVPREAWPRALAAAPATGPHTVYRVLQALGNSVGPVEGKESENTRFGILLRRDGCLGLPH